MPTTNTTTSSTTFNQNSMNSYNQLNGSYTNAIQQEISDPTNNMFFNNQLGMGQGAINQRAASANQALLQRSQSLGISPNSGIYQQQMGQLQRSKMQQNSQLYNNLLLQAGQMRQSAIQGAGSYRPLATGGTQTQSQGGIGSWLSPILGIAGGALGMAMGKPPSLGGGGGTASGLQAWAQPASQMSNPATANMWQQQSAPDNQTLQGN
jgi:hypothetical protein